MGLISSKIILSGKKKGEKERARRKKGGEEKKAMLTILVFIMATLTKKTVGRKGPFGGTFSKIGLHIDYDNSHGGLGH